MLSIRSTPRHAKRCGKHRPGADLHDVKQPLGSGPGGRGRRLGRTEEERALVSQSGVSTDSFMPAHLRQGTEQARMIMMSVHHA